MGSIHTTAFGQSAGSSGSSANPTMWNGDWGYRNDNDAGLVHIGARYYDSQVGRFVTRDTVLTEHPFLYCDGDPVNAVDPSGHWGWWNTVKTAVVLLQAIVGAPQQPTPPHWGNEPVIEITREVVRAGGRGGPPEPPLPPGLTGPGVWLVQPVDIAKWGSVIDREVIDPYMRAHPGLRSRP